MSKITRRNLWMFLKSHGVPLNKWGRGEAKTIDHLLAEINAGEVEIILSADEKGVVRRIKTAAINVYYAGETTLVLKEDRQIFKGGRIRRRRLDTSLGEKVKANENPEDSVKRALREELEIEEVVINTPGNLITKGPYPSLSFPGIYTENHLYYFNVFIPEHLYRPEGYVERQPDKETYFIWTLTGAPR